MGNNELSPCNLKLFSESVWSTYPFSQGGRVSWTFISDLVRSTFVICFLCIFK